MGLNMEYGFKYGGFLYMEYVLKSKKTAVK